MQAEDNGREGRRPQLLDVRGEGADGEDDHAVRENRADAEMTERPILFSAPMVRAIIASRKTQTRRVVKGIDECPHGYDGVVTGTVPKESHRLGKHCFNLASGESLYLRCPYGAPGDRLWVRESYWADATTKAFKWYVNEVFTPDRKKDHCRLIPGIHMPRKLCRVELEVTKVRVERLGSITEKDARAEGMLRVPFNVRIPGEPTHGWTSEEGQPVSTTAVRAFEDLFASINGGWFPEAWVWVVEFKRAPA